MKAFVTDGDQRPSLAVTRSLGGRGIEVLVGEERPVSLASSSRYAARHVTYPSPLEKPEAFDRFIAEFVAHEKPDVIIPVTDVTTYLIARRQDVLKAHGAVAAPSFDAFDFVSDKGKLLRHAETLGVAIPRTLFVENARDVERVLSDIQFPAVVKPCRSRIRTRTGWLSTTVHYASSPRDILHLYETVDYLATTPSLIQERVIGPGTGVFLLCDRGRLLTAFAHRRLREKPPSGGVSVLSESIPLDPQLRDEAMRLLEPLGWHGVAMVEYKRDSHTGRAVLMEVNGRFWGSLQLAIDAGIDFPFLCYQLARKTPLDLPRAYEVGVKSRWLLGDLDHLLIRLRSSRGASDAERPTRLQSMLAFLAWPGPHERSEIFRFEDPWPGFRELRRYIEDLVPHRDQQIGSPQTEAES